MAIGATVVVVVVGATVVGAVVAVDADVVVGAAARVVVLQVVATGELLPFMATSYRHRSMPEPSSADDQLAIQRTLHDYAWACDNGDWATLPTLFTPDAELDYSSTGGPAGGRDEVVAWLETSLTQVEIIQHVVSNFQIDVNGDDAEGRAMFFTAVKLPDESALLLTGGYYGLALVRSNDGWRVRRLYEDNRWMTPVS